MTSTDIHKFKDKIKNHSSKIYSKLLQKSDIKLPDINSKKVSLNTGFFTILFTLIWNGVILYYLHNIEDESCKCVTDWRHNFMKIVAYINITLSFIPLLTINIRFSETFLMVLGIIIIILNSIYIYAFYTYIGILNSTNCKCAIIDEQNLNYLLNYRRSSIVIFYVLGIITILTGIDIGFSININNRKFKYVI